jgi:hypothetical protein
MSDAVPTLSTTSDAPKVEQPAPAPPPPAEDNGELTAALNRLDGFAGQNGAGAQQALGAVKRVWSKRVERAVEARPDFRQVTEAPTLPISPAMGVAMMRTANPEDVAYHLGTNPKEAARIAKLSSPLAQSVEIGKLAERLAGNRSNATHAPASSHHGAQPASRQREPSAEEWLEKRTAEIQSRRIGTWGTLRPASGKERR